MWPVMGFPYISHAATYKKRGASERSDCANFFFNDKHVFFSYTCMQTHSHVGNSPDIFFYMATRMTL